MGVKVFFLTLLRFLLFLISAATLGCHAAQVALLNGDHDWFPKYYTYILYFVGPGVSTISAISLLFVSISNVKAIRGDRIFGLINAALMIAVVIVCTLKSEQILYGQNTRSPTTGFQSYCNIFNGDKTLFNRCWLSNGTWIGSIVLAVIWIILSFYVFIQQRSDIYNEEYEVYDFKSDIPMAITSNSPIIPHHHHQQQQQQPSPIVPPHTSTPLNNQQQQQDVYYDPQPTPNYFDYGYQYHQQQSQYHQQQQQQAVLDNNNSSYYYNPHQPQQQQYQQDSTYSPSPFKNNDDTTLILQDTSASANSSHASYTQSPHTPAATVTDSKIKQVPHAY